MPRRGETPNDPDGPSLRTGYQIQLVLSAPLDPFGAPLDPVELPSIHRQDRAGQQPHPAQAPQRFQHLDRR